MIQFMKLDPRAVIPQYHTAGAAGFDFHTLQRTVVRPRGVTPVPTGLAVEVPYGYAMLVIPRSGISVVNPTYISNSPGLVDSDYRGELQVLCIAWENPIIFEEGERFAQGVIISAPQFPIVERKSLSDTDRGGGGFGSTGR